MLIDLYRKYEERFDTEIILSLFLDLEEEEQIKILKKCLEDNIEIYENDYFNNKYMEEAI